jgi:hypothetical protein
MASDPIEAQRYLQGVSYPASKQEVIQTAESNGAPQDMIERLQAENREQFEGPEEVQRAFAGGL